MGVGDTKDDTLSGLGNRVLLSKIDSLRELNVGAIVPLPQVRPGYVPSRETLG